LTTTGKDHAMKYDAVKNPNYVATVVSLSAGDLHPLDGLDNLVGYNNFGMQALTSKDTAPGLYIMFSTEVQLSPEFAKANNLYRDGLSNADPRKTGYLEQNRRVKAIKLKGHRSESLLMPVESLSYLLSKKALASLREGDVFDSIDGHEVCRKYLIKEPKPGSGQKAKARVRRVHEKVFPEHLDSENYFRNAQKVPQDAHVTVSQKLHGTSVRYGHVPALADQRWWEKLLRRPRRNEHRFVVGSRRVVKSVDFEADEGKDHYYSDGDLWTRYADQHGVADLIPKDHIVYGELIGFSSPGEAIQKGYTYDLPDGEAHLYVYRVAMVTTDGITIDYSAAQMEVFCADRGLTPVPILWAGPHEAFVAGDWLERRYYDEWSKSEAEFVRPPVPLSDKKLVDEGVCVRYDGPHGTYIVKAKSPSFLTYESKLLDAGVEDVEAAEGEETAEDVAA
jgi:hypothetical protein